jgi:1,4-dihydroxy-2-naphthoyl-CoA hydrolase
VIVTDWAEVVAGLNEFGRDKVPGLFGMEMTRVDESGAEARLTVTPPLIAGTGYLFAPVVVGLADIICAFGMRPHIPEGHSFTTVELKTNFLSSAQAGEVVVGRAHPVHVGRTTVVWDCEVRNETTGRVMALFRNTQLVIAPRA